LTVGHEDRLHQASGLRKGVNSCGNEIAHQYDIFHIKREIKRWLRSQEARCYEQMEKTEQARLLLEDPRWGPGPLGFDPCVPVTPWDPNCSITVDPKSFP